MNMPPEYWQMKGLATQMPPEKQAEVEQARIDILAIVDRSDVAFMGLCLAVAEFQAKQK
jgi:hypothetical protein